MNNKAELKAILMIAEKMNWMNKPVVETLETIKQMVRNQQALELDIYGACNDEESTLLSIALWDKDKIASTRYVSDYTSLLEWNWYCLCEDSGCNTEDMLAILAHAEHSAELYMQEMEKAEEEEHYYNMMYDGLNWYNHAKMMG